MTKSLFVTYLAALAVVAIHFSASLSMPSIFQIATLAMLEEFVFRYLLLGAAKKRWGWRTGVIVSSVVFALAHLCLSQLPALFLSGLFLGLLFVWCGSLIPCVVVHIFHNILVLSVQGDDGSVLFPVFGVQLSGIEVLGMFLLFRFVLCALIWVACIKADRQECLSLAEFSDRRE